MQTTTAPIAAFDGLAAVHPRHAETLRGHVAAYRPGTIVTLATGTETGAFFTGVKSGDTVAVTSRTEYASGHVSTSVQVLDGDAAHLSVNSTMTLTSVDPADWTHEEALAAQRAATRAADDAMQAALAAGSGFGTYTPVNEEKALGHLRDAGALRTFAFAAGIYAEYIDGVTRRDGYTLRSIARATA